MELRCPHCGKKQNLTQAELTASDGMVICPQCVSEFSVDVSTIPDDAPSEQANPTPETEVAMKIAFCPTCGKHLPVKGLNFCPFCGAPLPLTGAAPLPQTPVVPSRRMSAEQPVSPEKSVPAEENAQQKLASLPFVKTSHLIARQHEPASWPFKIMAWTAIIVLVALFVLMVWHGNLE